MLLFPSEAPGVYAFCPVLTQLEVTGQLCCIAGHTILPKGGACTRKRWEGREGQGEGEWDVAVWMESKTSMMLWGEQIGGGGVRSEALYTARSSKELAGI